MFQRILSLLGFGYYGSMIGQGGGAAPGGGDEPPFGRDAEFRFESGSRLSDGDAVEGAQTAQNLTDQDLVWPGKKTSLGFANEEEVAARFQLSITDLPPTWYQRRAQSTGQMQDDGSVLLLPGEEVTFDVSFLQPPAASRVTGAAGRGEVSSRRVRNFRFVITRFDPRRLQDAGVVVGDEIARWVPLPDASDLAIQAVPPRVVVRPWRPDPVFRVEIENRSFLPPEVELTVVRAPTQAQLTEGRGVENVARHLQALAARTPGRWICRVPPAARRGSYFLGVVGSAQVADGAATTTLALPRPVYVKYVPYLRAGRDWLCLFCALFLLLWVTYGIPIRKAPLVQVQMDYASPGIPDDAAPEDLRVALIPISGRTEEDPIVGTLAEGKQDVWEFELPAQWYGRNPWGWNLWSRATRRFRIEASVRNEDTRDLWAANLDLGRIRPRVDGKVQSDTYFTLPAGERPFFDPWVAQRFATVPARADIRISLAVRSLGSARSQAKSVAVTATLNGKSVLTEEFPLIAGAPYLAEGIGLGVRPRTSGLLTVTAVTLPYRVSARPVTLNVRRQKEPFDIALNFSGDIPTVALRLPPTGVPSLVSITDPGDPTQSRTVRSDGKSTLSIPWPVRREEQPLKIDVLASDGRRLGGGTVALSTNPDRRTIDIPLASGAVAASPNPNSSPSAGGAVPGGTGAGSGNGGAGGAAQPVAQKLKGAPSAGDRLVIRGRYFGAAPGVVLLNQRPVKPTRWTAGAVVFTVPTDLAPETTCAVSLRLAQGQEVPAGSIRIRERSLSSGGMTLPNPAASDYTPAPASPSASAGSQSLSLPVGVTGYDLALIERYDDALSAVSAPGAMEDSPDIRDALKSYCMIRLSRNEDAAVLLANGVFRRAHRSNLGQSRTATAIALAALAQFSIHKGDGDQARSYLETATDRDPLCAIAWADVTELMGKAVSGKAAQVYLRKGVQMLERGSSLLDKTRSSALQYRLSQAAKSIGDKQSAARLDRRGPIVPELAGLIGDSSGG